MNEDMAVRSYDSKEVNLVVGGVVITGVASGSWISVERSEDDFTEYVGAKGEVALAETNNRTGDVTVTLDNTSPSCTYLYQLSKRRGRNALVDVVVVDANEEGRVRMSASQARVRRPANYESGNEIKEREFSIFCADLEFEV